MLISPIFFAVSCAFIKLQENLTEMASTGAVHGRIVDKSDEEHPIIVLAYDTDKKIARYKHLHNNNDYYLFMLPAGKVYEIMMFEDVNGDLKYEQGEPAGCWLNENAVRLSAGGSIAIDMAISKNNSIPTGYPTDINNLPLVLGDKFIVQTGAVADINNKIFSPEYGKKGLWRPLDFLKENGVGVFFLEKYDPDKIPILFIYGIGGCPQNWKFFFEKIDRTVYQAWFYYYPSGVRIAKASKALNIIVNELQIKYKFKDMFIVAHSMGGLVANDFIKRNIADKHNKYIKLFISISTPWEGDEDAVWAKYAPAVIPCWQDLSPNSAFIQKLSAKDLGSGIPYYLLFSYHGDRKPFRRNNDNVIYLSSQLKLEMQKKAEKLYGFDLKHFQILTNKSVLNICNGIFAEYNCRKQR